MKEAGTKAVPTEVYLSFVTSLFGNRGTLVTGVVAHVVCCAIIFADTGSRFFLGLIVAFLAVFLFRFYWFRRFDRIDRSRLTRDEMRLWERRYVYGAALTALLLGIASGYALAFLQDMRAVFVSVTVAIGSMISIVGRNYGSARVVTLQTAGCCVPIILGCFLSGDPLLMLVSLLLVPLGLTTRSMAQGVREFLSQNVLSAKQMVKIGGQLDIALNTTSHALVMLDAGGRVQAINRRAYELLDLDPMIDLQGAAFLSALGKGEAAPPPAILDRLGRLVQGSSGKTLLFFRASRWLEFSVSAQGDGGVVMIFEDVSARVETEEKILRMIRYDALTGLPKREHFARLAAEAIGQNASHDLAGLAILDIEGFKHVNDLQGHAIGDGLLAAIAGRLKERSADGDPAAPTVVVGRLVGDEFILLATGRDAEEIADHIRRIHAGIEGVYAVDDRSLSVCLNGGCVVLPAERFEIDAWQVKADLALNEAKASGNGSFVLFRPEMDERYVEEQRLRADLRRALDRGDLHVVYQPMFRPDGSRMACCEALVRWEHAERGFVGPDVFIPLAESMGLISRITRLVLDRACRDCATWPADLAVSVNLSTEDLRNEQFADHVAETLARHGLEARRLHVEVTESCFMNEPAVVRSILARLRASGVTIAIDDFGTGFSSLSYLDTLPVDMVKIDRSFVTDITTKQRKLKLLRGIVHLSRELGMTVVLEGVETGEQVALINRHGFADLVQGYVFSRPVDAGRILSLAAEQRVEAPEAEAPLPRKPARRAAAGRRKAV